MDTTFIRGIIPALITPMTEDEELDEEGLKQVLDYVIDKGVHGVFTVGTAGESWALTVEERQKLYAWTAKYTDGRVPVYVGTGATTTREAVLLARSAEASGADCLSVLTPYFTTPNEDQMFLHYAAIAESVSIPILMYDLPARTGNSLSVDLVVRLAESFENIVGIKDSSGDFTKAIDFLRRAPDGFRIIMGRDSLILAGLLHGAAGAIAASANVAPELGVGIYESFRKGDHDAALEYQNRLVPLRLAFSLGTHPAMLKAGAEMIGLKAGPPRQPASRLTESQCEKLRDVLVEIGTLTQASA